MHAWGAGERGSGANRISGNVYRNIMLIETMARQGVG